MRMNGGDIAIVGAAETTELGTIPRTSSLELHADAAANALADAGLGPADVDGFATAGPLAMEISHHLGIRPRWIDSTMIGGASFLLHVRHAAAAIAAGAADVVLITHGESGRSRIGLPPWGFSAQSLPGQYELPYGSTGPTTTVTLPAMSFLSRRGYGAEVLAEPVVAQRTWALGNPRARKNEPITRDEVLESPTIAFPFTREMCCVVTDGGGALVMTSAERAADLPGADRAVYVLGSGEASESILVSQMGEFDSFGAFQRSSADAFSGAGLTTADIDHLMIYDAFSHLPLLGLEDLGFVGRGESAAFISEGHTLPGGRLPLNTNGGGLAYTHTGMYGMFAILESVRQLRGEAFRQVPRVTTSMVQGLGLFYAAAASLVLSNRRP